VDGRHCNEKTKIFEVIAGPKRPCDEPGQYRERGPKARADLNQQVSAMAIQEHVPNDNVEECVGNQAEEVGGVGPIAVFVVDSVTVDGAQAAENLEEARDTTHSNQEVARQAFEQDSMKEKDTNNVDDVEQQKAEVGGRVMNIPIQTVGFWRAGG